MPCQGDGFLDDSVGQNLPALQETQETWVQPFSREDPLEKQMATHSSILARRILWTEEPGRLQVRGVAKSRTQLRDLAIAAAVRAIS